MISSKNENKKVVIVDIDNVLADYGGDFLRWATNGQLSPAPSDLTSLHLNDILQLDEEDYAGLKDEWRSEGHKRDMTMLPGAHGALRRLNDWYRVCLISSRPVEAYPRIDDDTRYWLQSNNLLQYVYDIIYAQDKFGEVNRSFNKGEVVAIFDDDPKNLVKFAGKRKYQCYIVDRPYNRAGAPFVHRFNTLYDAACHFIGMSEPWKE